MGTKALQLFVLSNGAHLYMHGNLEGKGGVLLALGGWESCLISTSIGTFLSATLVSFFLAVFFYFPPDLYFRCLLSYQHPICNASVKTNNERFTFTCQQGTVNLLIRAYPVGNVGNWCELKKYIIWEGGLSPSSPFHTACTSVNHAGLVNLQIYYHLPLPAFTRAKLPPGRRLYVNKV